MPTLSTDDLRLFLENPFFLETGTALTSARTVTPTFFNVLRNREISVPS